MPSSMQQQLQPRKRLHHISSSYQNYFDSWLFFVAVVVGSDFIPLIDVIKFLIFCLSSGTDFSSLLLSLAVILFHWSMWLSSSCSAWDQNMMQQPESFCYLDKINKMVSSCFGWAREHFEELQNHFYVVLIAFRCDTRCRNSSRRTEARSQKFQMIWKHYIC